MSVVDQRDSVVHELLRRWIADGLLSPDQASAIEAAERARTARGPDVVADTASRVPSAVEALGYVGGALAVVAGFLAVRSLWPDIPASAEMAFAGAGVVILLAGGAVIDVSREAAFQRLRGVLWALSAACYAALGALIITNRWDFAPQRTGLLIAATTTPYAATLWARTHAAMQHFVLFAVLAALVGTALATAAEDAQPWSAGLAVWTLSAAWGAAAHRTNRLPPRDIAYLVAALGAVVGAQLTMTTAGGHVLALATIAVLLTAGILLRRVWLLAIGAIAVVQIVPQTAVRYLPSSVAAPLAVFIVGTALLIVAVHLARSRNA